MLSQRLAAVAMLSGAAGVGCSLGSFDYLSSEYQRQGTAGSAAGGVLGGAGSGAASGSAGTGGDAGTGASGAPAIDNPCQDRDDGTPCDDDDVCTLTSLCAAGVCQGSSDHPCVVADSIAEFSMTQGLQGFWYGAWPQGADPDSSFQESDFVELMVCPGESWKPACVDMADPTFRWTLITAELAHAATIPQLELPVRRWVSDVSGPVVASLDHHHADPGDGDGTKAQLLLDGVTLWENEIDPSDAAGKQIELRFTVAEGTRVELLLHPRANQARDMTHFSMVLRGN